MNEEINGVLKPEIAKLMEEAQQVKEAREAIEKQVEEMTKEVEHKKLLEKQLKEVETESKS
jgi:septal ring factor EnvC (AmiA/AmiB activator)